VPAPPAKRGAAAGELDFIEEWYPIQVKQKDKAGRRNAGATRHTCERGFSHQPVVRLIAKMLNFEARKHDTLEHLRFTPRNRGPV